jgi:hypothetical protein
MTEQEKIIKRFESISDKYHKMSLLFYELSQSLRLEIKKKNLEHSPKKFKEYLKTLDLDYKKIKKLSLDMSNINLSNLKGG